MFVGRQHELEALENLYRQDGFRMVVVYGRRRVGKTRLVDEFAKGKRTLHFTAQQKSAALNLRQFSEEAYRFFGVPGQVGPFETWSAALSFVAAQARTTQPEPLTIVFDEFPYAAEAEPSLPSALQIAIDREFKGLNMLMVLCGSNESFMESEVLGRKSPLYGRRNAQIRLLPFDYLDTARMLGPADPEDLLKYYATFGGTPYYLEQVDAAQGYERNVERLCFDMSGVLYEEPLALLRQELREPALYNSVLDAIGSGATQPKRIAERAGIEAGTASKCLKTLEDLRIVRKDVPHGENPKTTRKGIYSLDDPFFAYWYAFVSPRLGAIESGAGRAAAESHAFGDGLSTYLGKQFERMCLQWLARENAAGRLPFLATSFGSWWGTDPAARERTDIDVVASGGQGELLVGECKFRNDFDETAAVEGLLAKRSLVRSGEARWFYLFSKQAVRSATSAKYADRPEVRFVTLENLYAEAEPGLIS